MLKRTLIGVGLLVGSWSAQAQETLLLREPTIFQDQIVFVYANDLWSVSRDGGQAVRLTTNDGGERVPHFSPDGKHIAFSGQYDGNTDVFVMPATGGQPKRLTYHPGTERVTGWTPDGQVLFTSSRSGMPTAEEQFFKVPITGGTPEPLPIPRANNGQMSADGKYVAFQQTGFWDPEWRNYRGGQAKPIWVVNLRDYSLQKTTQADNERHTDPIWHLGKVYYLSERDYANNIWVFDPATGQDTQVTFHTDFDVKSLDAGPGGLVYEQGGRIHLLDVATRETKPLKIEVKGDFFWARKRYEDVSGGSLSNPNVSPTGKRAVFEYRGEIFTVPREHGTWRNLTQNSGVAERYPVWSPKGDQLAWFSDASGEYALVIADQEGQVQKTITHKDPSFFFHPEWSPDGKYLAFTDTDYNMHMVEVATGKATLVATDRYAHPNRTFNPVWSPDSRYIAFAQLVDTQYKVIKAYEVATGKTLQLTDGMADCLTPAWDASGKYLYILASTDYGLNTGWLDMSAFNMPVTRMLYALVLDKNTPNPLAPRSDEEPTGEAAEEEGGEPTVSIHMEGLPNRMVALGVPERNYQGVIGGPKGTVFFTEQVPNQRGLVLHQYVLKNREAKEFMSGISEVRVSHDLETLLYQAGGTWGMVGTSGSAKVGDGRLDMGGMRLHIDPEAEWHQIFKEGWRYMRDFLYVENVHGAPWDKVYDWYAPWIDHVRHRSDLNYVVDIMSGEVSVGHSYTSGGDYPDLENIPVGLLGADYAVKNNHYQITKVYTGESWNPDLRAPLSGPGIVVNAGDYLVGINGREITADQNLYQYFEGTAGRATTIMVNSRPALEGAREYLVEPLYSEGGLRSFDWIEANRRKVDELSNGQLAYVYVPNTGNQGYEYFNRYYFAQQDKAGAIIDERNNGGGYAADYMVDIMARELIGYFNSRASDHRPFTTPMSGIWGPKVMLMNERAGSGGDLLPYLFKEMEIGPLVGTQTWGGLVGTWDTPPFVDGGRMVAPRGGFYDANGEWAIEGVGVAPDVEVENLPADVIAGKDPQLERAVQEALKLLETQRVELKPEPAAPIRYHRPEGNR